MTEHEKVRLRIEGIMKESVERFAPSGAITNSMLGLIAMELAEIVGALRDAREREDES